MKRKPKKFLSGGEVAALAGLGYLGYQAYKDYQAGKDKGDYKGLKVSEEAKEKFYPSKFKEDKAIPERVKEDKEYASQGRFPQEAGEGTSGAGLGDKEAVKTVTPTVTSTFGKSKRPRTTTTKAATDTTSKAKDGTRYTGEGMAGSDQKAVERSVMGVNKNITTPGTAKAGDKRGSTHKGRSENPIEGTFENAGRSMARTPQQIMRERAQEVQRRREEAEKSRYKKGGTVKKYAAGGSVSSASKRADGIAMRGKTRGRIF